MKLTKGRIHKIMKSHCQTAKACATIFKKRGSSSGFTKRNIKTANLMNKTMYRTRCISETVK